MMPSFTGGRRANREDEPSGPLALGIRLAINAAALWVTARVVSGIEIEGWRALLGTAFILGAVNMFVKPVAQLLGLPLSCLTLGLFVLVINGAMLLLTAWIAGLFDLSVHVDGFWSAVLGALLISVIGWLLGVLVLKPLMRNQRRRRLDGGDE